MIPIYLYLVGSGLVGFGFWLGRTSGRASEQRNREQVIDDVVRRRMGWRDAEPGALPVQVGTLAENRRRLELTATPHEPELVEDWPRLWRLCWPVLLFAARFWWTPVGVAVDRAVVMPRVRYDRAAVALWALLGRLERHWWTDLDHSPHNFLAPHTTLAGDILLRLATERASADPPIPDPGSNPRRYILRPGWSVPEIPATVELGELVRS